MHATKRLITLALALAMLAVFPLSAMAADEVTDEAVVTDVKPDVKLSDRTTDHPQRPEVDRPTDDKPTDRPTDRPKEDDEVRDRCLLTDNPRRCLSDHPSDHLNIRQLIWRLIKAHEWEKLFRLLHWLGLI